ncbi:chemotaxis protein CheC [Salsuginibacillus halophilus]|uniref:Chemotaxis protein CheC n=1 Tax=Salsuginibacillus halophilus TaxID=517424 RepID=A0A2P8HY88_9BACI|nr:chemotaxis protein CheC [Salsuginibacillus halophilus]PSL51211.1 chemotaxis protein CheC [Salsuginibacillus halophilus]
MDIIEEISDHHLDVLKEIGNIGAGNAATSLSQLLAQQIEMTVPSVRPIKFQEIPEAAGGAEQIVAATFLRILGDAPGSMFFIVPEEDAAPLVASMTGMEHLTVDSELGSSALQELGNILSGSYLSALADFTRLNLQPSPPSLAVDMAGAVVEEGLFELSLASDHALIIDTVIYEHGTETKSRGQFFLLPDPDSFSTIFTSLGVGFHE